MTLRSFRATWPVMLLAASVMVAAGCSSSDVRQVNDAAIASRISLTDTASRDLARQSLVLLKDRAADYRVGPEDLLEVSIYELETRDAARTVDVRVTESGIIALPILGELKIEDLSAEQVKQLIEKQLKETDILRFPRVSVTVKEYRSKRIAVVGAVRQPGVFTLRQNATSLLEALTLAGGLSERAGQILYVIRPQTAAESAAGDAPQTVISIDLFELLETGGALALNAILQNGDIVNVPEAKQFFVVGFVREPGGFTLNKPTTVLEGIALAKGLRETEASPHACVLKRQTAQGATSIPVDLVRISHGTEPNLYLMPNDIIDVRQTTARKVGMGVLGIFRDLFSVGYSLNR